MSNNSRRNFLQKAGLAAASFYIVPRHVLGKGYTAPSDKLNIMGIGGGGKGYSDIMNSYNKGAENIVAIVDVDDRQIVRIKKDLPQTIPTQRLRWRRCVVRNTYTFKNP